MTYVPEFTCPFCGNVVGTEVSFVDPFGVSEGSVGVCGCAESRKAADERSHLAYESRKKRKRHQ